MAKWPTELYNGSVEGYCLSLLGIDWAAKHDNGQGIFALAIVYKQLSMIRPQWSLSPNQSHP